MNISIVKVDLSYKVMTSISDKEFLEKATKVILDNIADGSFTLDRLVVDLKISRASLYRKINFLTGQNPSGFIRTIRLKYAACLLEQQELPINKIAVLSGFNSKAYFSKTFRELFGQTPQQYQYKKRTLIPVSFYGKPENQASKL